MAFIRRKLKQLIRWAERYGMDDDSEVPTAPSPAYNTVSKASGKMQSTNLNDMNNGMHFTVFRANGGTVVQTQHYNVNTDKSRTELYVITDKENLGEELGQIITRENLSR